MKIKNLLKKVSLAAAGIGTFIISGTQYAYADAASALGQAKTNVIGQAKPIVNNTVVPIIDVVLVAILLVVIARTIISYRRGAEVELLGIVLLIAGTIVVSTFPIWGWAIIPN